MKKKILVIIGIVLVLSLGLVACGKQVKKDLPTPTSSNTSERRTESTSWENSDKTTHETTGKIKPVVDPDYGNEYLATDEDFTWVGDSGWGYIATNKTGKGYYKYTGDKTIVKIPHVINEHPMTSYFYMFEETMVEKVISDNSNITDMSFMFYKSKATTLDLSNFDTSNVTDMSLMFTFSQATTLDLSSFDTSNVTNMGSMFYDSQATTLDLSSFDTSNDTYMKSMFYDSKTTTGYARTQADADRLNNEETNRPSELTFVVKP